MAKVKLTVTESRCRDGLCKAGDTFIVEGLCPPLCHELWSSVYPQVFALLNGAELDLPGKASGDPYYLMDLLEYSGIDFNHLDKPVELLVNGGFGQFSQRLYENDDVVIRQGERQ